MSGILGDVLGMIAAGGAARSVANADIAAEHGVLGATGDAQTAIRQQLQQNQQNVNQTLAGVLGPEQANAAAYLNAGQQGVSALAARGNPQFNFSLADYLNSPAMQFEMEQGTNAIINRNSAAGLGSSGAALKELTRFGQGLASTYYNDAFNRAQAQFQTNQNASMQNLGMLMNAGQFGTGQQFAQGQQSLGMQEFLANQGLQGMEYQGGLGLEGATRAGLFAQDAGAALGAGKMARGKFLGDLISNALNLAGTLAGAP